MRYFYCLGLLFSLTFCAPPGLMLSKNARVTHLGISVKYDMAVPTPVQKNVDYNIDNFIKEYNLSSKGIKLSRTFNSSDSSTLSIHVLGTRLVSQEQQVLGAVVSIIGFSLPFIMIAAESDFYFTFWYFPKVLSVADFSLSPDINGSEKKIEQHIIKSPGFLKSLDTQIEKHGPSFRKDLVRVLKNLETKK